MKKVLLILFLNTISRNAVCLVACIVVNAWGTISAQTNIAPTVLAEGDQVYCPLTSIPITTDFTITDPDDTEVEAFFIQISIGYQVVQDTLRLTGNHPNIVTTWSEREGRLSLRGIDNAMLDYDDLIAAVKDVIFESRATNPTEEKFFSLAIGDANFLPLTGNYYEYVPSTGILWTTAREEAENRTYFGLQGYLATVLFREESQLIGEQAAGAGWVGGSDAAVEGEWRWVTGPETGTVFWRGGVNGNTPNFAFWNTGEPNNIGGDTGTGEDYVHITDPSVGILGSWNDLRNTGEASGPFQPKGYVVEYGGTPGDPIINLSGSTKLTTPRITDVSNEQRCGSGTVMLNATTSTGNTLWFDAENDGNQLFTGPNFTTPEITETTTYYVQASFDGCLTGERMPITATILPITPIETDITFRNCDEDGVSDGFVDFNLNEITPLILVQETNVTVTYHISLADAGTGENALDPLGFNNGIASTIHARVENTFGCFSIATISLEVSTTSFSDNFLFGLVECDIDERDGFTNFDFTVATAGILAQFPGNQDLKVEYYRTRDDAILEQNEILNTTLFRNETAFLQILYVRVESLENGDCFGLGPHLQLSVRPLVAFEVLPEAFVCTGTPIELSVFNAQDNYTYRWMDSAGIIISNQETVSIDIGGAYTVVGSSFFGCESLPQSINVAESSAPILIQDFIVVDDLIDTNSITVLDQDNNIGLGDYEYALNSPFGPFQDSPIFTNVAPGIHILFAADQNGCGADQIVIAVVGVPNFFTPNNDGVHDTLNIRGITKEFYTSANVFIMDRFGNLLSQVDGFGPGWNGNLPSNNRTLPASDYWYLLELIDVDGNRFERRGHFSLLR